MTLNRMNQVSYLPITFVTGLRLLVKKNSGIHGIEDMKLGKAIGVTFSVRPMTSSSYSTLRTIISIQK